MMGYNRVGGSEASSATNIWISRVSEIASGAMCEAKMHYCEVVALWYICIIKSICGLAVKFQLLWFNIIQIKLSDFFQ